MTSLGTTPIDLHLDKRFRPSSQIERVPALDQLEDELSRDDSFDPSEAGSLRAANFLLPNGLLGPADSPAIRTFRAASAPSPAFFSPVFSHFPQIRPEKLRAASPDAQRLRRQLLRGASVLIVMGGYSGKHFIYERLHSLGVRVTIIDGPDSPWRAAAARGLIHEFIELDFTEWDSVLERALDAIAASDTQFDACTTFFEDAVSLAARIALARGVETNSVDACDRARNKRVTRQVMRDCGLAVPKFWDVRSQEDVRRGAEVVGFPAILKPVHGAASLGVKRVESVDEAIEAYENNLATLTVDSDTIWAQGVDMVLEEYYDGDEFDVDLLLSEGDAVYSKVSDNWRCLEPYYQESGTNCPSLYPEAKQKELIDLAISTTQALGFKYGAFHVELKYTTRGPRLIEVNARMGGVSVRDANLYAWGVDLVEEHTFSALKIPMRPVVPEKPLAFFAEVGINAPYSGVVNADNWLACVAEDPRVKLLQYEKKSGDKVVGPEDGMPDWLAEVRVVSTKSVEDALDFVRALMTEKAPIPVTPSCPEAKPRVYFFPDDAHPFVKAT